MHIYESFVILFLLLDGPQGNSNVLVDAQRNRIMMTKSFKEAERLASERKSHFHIFYY